MKDLITTIASIFILSLFFMQYVTNMAAFDYMMDVEHCLREISYEYEEYDSENKVKKGLDKKLMWNSLTPSVNQIEDEDGYRKYEVTVAIPNVSPRGPLKYTTNCIIRKEGTIEHEEHDNHDSTSTDFNVI